MNVLVLGGNGYQGSKVVGRLVEKGRKVIYTKRKRFDFSKLSDLEEMLLWIPSTEDAIESVSQFLLGIRNIMV